MSAVPVHDVVIVGAGIAGAALAASLAPLGLDVLLVDGAGLPPPKPAIAATLHQADPRVSALNAASRTLLERCGAWRHVPAEVACAYRAMRVWEQDGTGAIGFDAGELGVPELGHIIENRWIIAALMQALSAADRVALRGNTRLASLELPRVPGEPLELALGDAQRVRARLVVGADGAHSAVRERAGIALASSPTGQRAIVATIQTTGTHAETAWQCFLATGPLALLPLATAPRGHCCSIVWSAEEAEAARLLALDDAGFAGELERASERCAGSVAALTRRLAFPLQQQHALSYVAPGVALIGDAAHVVHPLAGQGINLGLADVRVLVEEIAGAGAVADPQALARYARRRRTENALMLEAMSGFRRLFGDTRPAVRLLRNFGVRAVDRMAPLKHAFMRRAMGFVD